MKLIKKYIEKDGTGDVTLCPEDSEDLWHAYNLISEGDLIRATSIRKVQRESTTSTESERVRITLTISVETIHFDTASSILRLNGKNSAENKFVKMGAYHSLELELNKNFTITKPFWDSVTLERLEAACDPAKSADVGAVILQEGLANICLITNTMTIVRLRVEIPIPRKGKGGPEQHDKAMERFYEATLQGILRHFHFDILKCVIIASPGFVKDQLSEYIFTEALRRDLKVLTENKPKFVLAHSSSGHKYSLKEVMTDPSVAAKLSDTKAAGEVKCLNDFYDMLKTDPDRAFYGLSHVSRAVEQQAVQVLLISDNLFRSKDVQARKKYIKIVETVRENGGDVKIFSSLHVSGENLEQLSGIAAILRFPIPDIDDEEEDAGNHNEAK